MPYKISPLLLCLVMIGCTSNPPAPVSDKTAGQNKPINTKPSSTKPSITNNNPNGYVVKKGDTLYSIGLEHGQDYREIAAANNISAPYHISIGQRLVIPNYITEAPASNTTTAPTKEQTDNAVIEEAVTTAIGTDTVASPTPVETTAPTNAAPVLSQPQASRITYSQAAYDAPVIKPTEVVATPTTAKDNSKPVVTNLATGDLKWSWPTQGKLVGKFNEGSNKGIDIAGTQGQSITAAASGKVIYSGSDLRGYGKMIIIKHNPTFLSVYAHNNTLLVKEGQQVNAGQAIAEMGNTDSKDVKLHFEIRNQGKSVDPMQYLK
jgi:lipoprotein NlpD